jgi:molybdopterin molybdotransferase
MEATGARVMRSLLPLDDAIAEVTAAARPLASARVAIDLARGRICAEAVAAADDVPGFDNSAMDGFALRAADTAMADEERPARMRIVGESRAGAPFDGIVGAGEATRISTGAVLPAGADAVVPIEEAGDGGDVVTVPAPTPAGQHVRRAGEDIVAGTEVLAPGARLGPAELGVLASVGVAEVTCARQPAITVLTTGDELTPPGRALEPGAIRDSNAHTVPAQALAAGCRLVAVEHVPDSRAATEEAIERGLADDLLVVTGGVSVGPHDHVKGALDALGVGERFWGIALRPGRPTWFGIRDSGPAPTLVFGLPGNPVSAMVTFELLVRPAVAVMTGGAPVREERLRAVLDEPYRKRPGRLHAVRCSLTARDDGWHARPTGPQASHILTSMLGADGLAMIEADRGDVAAGETVDVQPLRL